jgi:hypothetical protein
MRIIKQKLPAVNALANNSKIKNPRPKGRGIYPMGIKQKRYRDGSSCFVSLPEAETIDWV